MGDPAGDRLVTGDAVNVAVGLQQAADPGEVLVGHHTYRLVRDAIRVEAVEPLALKRRREPVRAYRLVELLPGAAPFARRRDVPTLAGRMDDVRASGQARTAFTSSFRSFPRRRAARAALGRLSRKVVGAYECRPFTGGGRRNRRAA